MSVKVHVIFYSMYGHVFEMAEAIAAGARTVAGVEVRLFQVPELVPEEILVQSGAAKERKAFANVPIVRLEILQTPTVSSLARQPVSATCVRKCAISSI